MIIGQVLNGKRAGTTDSVYYSPWFPRGGNGAVMSVQIVDYGGSLSAFQIDVQHKNSEQDDGSATSPANSSQSLTSGGSGLDRYATTSWEVGDDVNGSDTGLLELVRFKYTLVFTTNGDEGWVHFRMLAPQWLSNGA